MNSTLKQATVLIVDDFQGMRTMLRDFLKDMSVAKIDTASNGREAMNLLTNNKYDIVVCDYNLGAGQNGQQILEECKMRNLIGLSTIWVMVTAEKTHDMVMGAAEIKPDDYLLKPINQSLLESRLVKQLERKKTLAPIEAAIKTKNYAQAIVQCDQQLAAKVLNPQEILRIKSDMLLTMGDYAAAEALYTSILAVRDVPWAMTGMGRIHFAAGRYEKAQELFERVLEDNNYYMEASDWLAKTYTMLGDSLQAERVLVEAVRLSPNSPVRQKMLGDTAYKNGSLDIAQSAYEKNIKISEFSPHKNPSAYTGLAKVLVETSSEAEALKILSQSKKEFKYNTEAALQAAAAEGMIYQKMGQQDKADAAAAEADKLLTKLGTKLSPSVAMEVAHSMLKMGKKDKACEMLRDVVKNNHENPEIRRHVQDVFEIEDLGDEGRELVEESTKEVVAINNEGVTLAKKGDFDAGMELLRAAARKLPGSEVILINLCGLLIGKMAKEGRSDKLALEARELIDRVRSINPANKNIKPYSAALARILGAG